LVDVRRRTAVIVGANRGGDVAAGDGLRGFGDQIDGTAGGAAASGGGGRFFGHLDLFQVE